MDTEQNKRTIGQFFKLVSNGLIDEALELFDDDVDWSVNAVSIGTRLTKEIVRERMKATRAATAGTFHIWSTGMTAEGDRIAVEAESRGSYSTGLEYNNLYHYLFVLRNRRIIRVAQYCDTAHMKTVVFPSTSPFANVATD